MPNLYCKSHGEAKRLDAINTQAKYAGEFSKIVYGKLIADGTVCAECNKPLWAGETAYFVEYLTVTMPNLNAENDYFIAQTMKKEIY